MVDIDPVDRAKITTGLGEEYLDLEHQARIAAETARQSAEALQLRKKNAAEEAKAKVAAAKAKAEQKAADEKRKQAARKDTPQAKVAAMEAPVEPNAGTVDPAQMMTADLSQVPMGSQGGGPQFINQGGGGGPQAMASDQLASVPNFLVSGRQTTDTATERIGKYDYAPVTRQRSETFVEPNELRPGDVLRAQIAEQRMRQQQDQFDFTQAAARNEKFAQLFRSPKTAPIAALMMNTMSPADKTDIEMRALAAQAKDDVTSPMHRVPTPGGGFEWKKRINMVEGEPAPGNAGTSVSIHLPGEPTKSVRGALQTTIHQGTGVLGMIEQTQKGFNPNVFSVPGFANYLAIKAQLALNPNAELSQADSQFFDDYNKTNTDAGMLGATFINYFSGKAVTNTEREFFIGKNGILPSMKQWSGKEFQTKMKELQEYATAITMRAAYFNNNGFGNESIKAMIDAGADPEDLFNAMPLPAMNKAAMLKQRQEQLEAEGKSAVAAKAQALRDYGLVGE